MNNKKCDKTFKVMVPAHLASERLERKVLIDIRGKPMLLRVLEQCEKAVGRDNVCVVTPDDEIFRQVSDWDFEPKMSPEGLSDGTSAIVSVLNEMDAELIINVQGDQPVVPPAVICELLDHLSRSDGDVVTPVFKITTDVDLGENGVAKVVRDITGRALYFSRSPIPYIRGVPYKQWLSAGTFWGHYGIYGYRREVLLAMDRLNESILENCEKLEQLRFLENGLKIDTFETPHRQMAVDTETDLKKILDHLVHDE